MKKYIFLIIILGFLVYLPSLLNGFVWDDEEQIVNNTIVHNLSNFIYFFKESTFNTGGAGLSGWYYKPFMTLSFSINYQIFNNHAFGFHLFQLLIHLCNCVIVFLLFLHFFRNNKTAFILSLIFAIHPAISEAVFYVSATQEVLFSFFSLLSIILLIKIKNIKLLSFLVYTSILFSLFSKESALLVIPIIVIYCYLFDKKKLLPMVATVTLSLLTYLFFRLVVAKIGFHSYRIVPISKASLWERIITIPHIIFSYIRLIFLPINLATAQHFVVRSIGDIRFWGSLIIIFILVIFKIFVIKKFGSRNYIFFLLWFILSISLLLNIFPLDMSLAERWLYFPIIGFLGIVGSFASLWQNKKTIIFFALVIILLSTRTVLRGFNWKNGLNLFEHDIKYSTESFDLENNLGVELFRIGKFGEAKTHFEKSIFLAPDWWTNYNNLGAYYQRINNHQKAEELYRKSLKNSDYFLAYENLAALLFNEKKYKETIIFCQESLKKLPYNIRLRMVLSLSYYVTGDYENAEKTAYELAVLIPTNSNRLFYQNIKERKIK